MSSFLAALEVVSATNDEYFIKIKTFPYQWLVCHPQSDIELSIFSLQPLPPTLPMYRSPCWCVTRGTHASKTVVCIPSVYMIGAPKCGTSDFRSNMWRHPLVERADKNEQGYFSDSPGGISSHVYTVKPVYNDHLMGYFSAFWSSSRWPRATLMSSRRQTLLARVNWYLQSSLKRITE